MKKDGLEVFEETKRTNIENLLVNWCNNNSVVLDTEQLHSLLYGVVPSILEEIRK